MRVLGDAAVVARPALALFVGVFGVSCAAPRPIALPEFPHKELFRELSCYEDYISDEDLEEEKAEFLRSLEDYRTSSTQELLAAIKQSPYRYGRDEPGRMLAHRGTEVLPELLVELSQQDDYCYYYYCLLNILSDIPCRKRDRAFLNELRDYLEGEREGTFLDHWTVPTLMRALAANGCRTAIPTIEEFVEREDRYTNISAEARIALNVLGKPALRNDAKTRYTVREDVTTRGLKDIQRPLSLFESLLNNGVLGSGSGLEMTAVERDTTGRTLIHGSAGEATWTLELGRRRGKRVPFYFFWSAHRSIGDGHCGFFEKTDSGYLVMFWEELWVS